MFFLARYEFQCLECKKTFEIEQGMKEKHVSACIYCNNKNTKRIFSIPHINVISDKDLSARFLGVPKSRLEKTKELKDNREKRKKDPKSEQEIFSNELHVPHKKQH